VRVRRWAWVASAPALAGARLVEVGDATDYIPFSQSATTPDPGGSYGSPKRLTIVLSVAALNADNVAFMTVSVLDGNDHSEAVLIAGPKARSVQFMPIGGTGGGPTCAAY
jgi:hypothetical protein